MTYDIPSLTTEAVELLKSLIAIPSLSHDEEKAADRLQNYIEMQGMATGRKGNNVWCLSPMFDLHKPTLLLNSHIDTVRPVNGWRKDPFKPTLESNGKLYGLCSNDAGASVVSLLQEFLTLCRTTQAYNLLFLASCEEEVSGKNGIECVLPELPPVTFAIVGEPTEMQPAIAEKGLMVLDVTATGRFGHAARNEGDNAIYKVLEDIAWFRDYRFPKESPLLGPVKMSVTMVNAGTQHNVIPDRCTFTVDIRSNECYMLHQPRTAGRNPEAHHLHRRAPLHTSGFFACGTGAPDCTESRRHGTRALRLPHPLRPGADALPLPEDGTGKERPLAHGG